MMVVPDCCGQRMSFHPSMDQVFCDTCRRVLTGEEMLSGNTPARSVVSPILEQPLAAVTTFDAIAAIHDDVNKLYEQGINAKNLVYLTSPVHVSAVDDRLKIDDHGQAFRLFTVAGEVEVIADKWHPLGSVHRMYRCGCGALFVDDRSRLGKCAVCLHGYTLSARLGHLKHGPSGSGLAGPCDADCPKCKAEQAACNRPPWLPPKESGGIPPRLKPAPTDPLDVAYDDCTLRDLLYVDELNRRKDGHRSAGIEFTPAQRAAVSAHWSAELRARVAAAKQKDRNQVTMENDE